MSKVKEETIKSFTDFVLRIERIRRKVNRPLWYRGCGKSTFPLSPTLYRHRDKRNIQEFIKLENQLMTRFKDRSIPFHTRKFEDNWDLLFFMQHYGIPTRLLDWTENPFFALFFAVTFCQHISKKRGQFIYKDDVAVWILDPIGWNRHALNFKSFHGEILGTNEPELSSYKPPVSAEEMNNPPVAMFGAHNSQRIVAQRGVFTVFGKSTESMEKMFEIDQFPSATLTKLVFLKGDLEKIQQSLRDHGITDSVVFPDLDGLARETKREFGFEV
jgi:hypothetical protein